MQRFEMAARRLTLSGYIRLFLAPAKIALHYAGCELPAAGVARDPFGQLGDLIDGDFQPHLVVVNRYRLGHREREQRLGDLGRAGIEADEIDAVLREARTDQ